MISSSGSSILVTQNSSSPIYVNGSRSSVWSCTPTRRASSSSGGSPPSDRGARGVGKPETFDFLGFTHICATTKNGRFRLKRITISKRMRAKLKQVKTELRRRRHRPVPVQGRWLASVVRGHLAYYAVPGNSRAVRAFRTQVIRHWCAALRDRSQRHRLNWDRMNRLVTRWLPPARIVHPVPRGPLLRHHLRQEPSALAALAGICAGGRPQGRSLPQKALLGPDPAGVGSARGYNRGTREVAGSREGVGGGRSSDDGQDNTTWSERRTPTSSVHDVGGRNADECRKVG